MTVTTADLHNEQGHVEPGLARLTPVSSRERIQTLDILRGWAVLGILAVNALLFVWPFSIQMNPQLLPFSLTGADGIGAWVNHVFFQDKFRSLFSILFGVSVYLVGGERSDLDRGELLRRRLFWLGVFGLLHGMLIWYGDILLHYALCGLIALLFRSWKASSLLWLGGGLTLAFGLIAMGFAMMGAMMAGQAETIDPAQGNPFFMSAEAFDRQIAAWRDGWPPALIENLKSWGLLQVFSLFLVPVTVALMALGMGLYKSGFLSGRAPAWVYVLFMIVGAANLAVLGWSHWQAQGLQPGETPMTTVALAAACFAPVITLGYASLLILISRSALKAATAVLAPVGRMAFTNYLSQSLIMATLFYLPWGPGWFATLGPAKLWGVVAAVWLAQLIWSPLWLSAFRMGPLEWLWRCLTYGRLLPIRKTAEA